MTSKLQSQIDFFILLNKVELHPAILGLENYKKQVQAQKDKRDLLTIESRAGHLYFSYYAKLFHEEYNFDSRHGGGLVMSNRYASDVINGLLNYGYAILAIEIAKFVNGVGLGLGLDPYYGFMHKTHNSFQALVYDLIEPFRWLVEYAAYKLAVEEPRHSRVIAKDEYAWTREEKIILDSKLILRFLELLERTFQNERPYTFKYGIKRIDRLSVCQEITIAKIQIQKLVDYCIRKEMVQIPSAPRR
jgi:CRISP-associated protein Cas1